MIRLNSTRVLCLFSLLLSFGGFLLLSCLYVTARYLLKLKVMYTEYIGIQCINYRANAVICMIYPVNIQISFYYKLTCIYLQFPQLHTYLITYLPLIFLRCTYGGRFNQEINQVCIYLPTLFRDLFRKKIKIICQVHIEIHTFKKVFIFLICKVRIQYLDKIYFFVS